MGNAGRADTRMRGMGTMRMGTGMMTTGMPRMTTRRMKAR